MKYLLFLTLFSFSACNLQKETETYIVKYGSKEIGSADFINTLMVLGFTKHGKVFYSKIYDADFFEKTRAETLEHIINSLFYGSLSQKYKIKITDSDLENWIQKRTPGLNKEDLLYTLKANNLSYSAWKGLFRDQFIQTKISEKLNGIKVATKIKVKKSNDDALKMAVISFEDQLQAKEHYNKIRRNKINYDKVLQQKNNTSQYSWIKTKDLSFHNSIKYLPLRKVSKPIKTSWGYSLVRIQKRGKYPIQPRDAATSQTPSAIRSLLEDFKKDPKLDINTERLYSLKIKK